MSFFYVAVASVLTVGQVYQADQARKSANGAADQAKTNALTTQRQADEANNAANARSPDTAAAKAANILAAQAGNSSTMLTGPQGVNPNSLTLGKTTLLGG